MTVKPNNLSRLESGIRDNHRPFIVYDVETTGVMNGNDNRITQVALASYAYNERENCYDLQDKIFMLAKPDASVLRNIQDIEHMQAMNPEKTVVDKLKDDFFYNLVKNETANMVDKDRIEATKEEYRELRKLMDMGDYFDTSSMPRLHTNITDTWSNPYSYGALQHDLQNGLGAYKGNDIFQMQYRLHTLGDLKKMLANEQNEREAKKNYEDEFIPFIDEKTHKMRDGYAGINFHYTTVEVPQDDGTVKEVSIKDLATDIGYGKLVIPSAIDDWKPSDIDDWKLVTIDFNKGCARPLDDKEMYASNIVAQRLNLKTGKSEFMLQPKNLDEPLYFVSEDTLNKMYDLCAKFSDYCTNSRVEAKIDTIKQTPKIEQYLEKQGLDIDRYIKAGEGLTNTELQIGITEFLTKYATADTMFVNNGTYFCNHYMQKQGLTMSNDADHTIDLTQAQRSLKGGVSTWTADFDTFAKNYATDTGKNIKIFDAFTKSLCMAEMVAKATNIPLNQNSQKHLENAVKEATMSQDKDYVMSLSRASSMQWHIIPERAEIDGFRFSSLEYVDFGNDRRYVDLDKMFEMNNNFEITLNGEKTPIKTWEELENKIKALNSEISEELLESIHEKYNEIHMEAEQKKQMPIKGTITNEKVNERISEIITQKTKAEESHRDVNTPERRETASESRERRDKEWEQTATIYGEELSKKLNSFLDRELKKPYHYFNMSILDDGRFEIKIPLSSQLREAIEKSDKHICYGATNYDCLFITRGNNDKQDTVMTLHSPYNGHYAVQTYIDNKVTLLEPTDKQINVLDQMIYKRVYQMIEENELKDFLDKELAKPENYKDMTEGDLGAQIEIPLSEELKDEIKKMTGDEYDSVFITHSKDGGSAFTLCGDTAMSDISWTEEQDKVLVEMITKQQEKTAEQSKAITSTLQAKFEEAKSHYENVTSLQQEKQELVDKAFDLMQKDYNNIGNRLDKVLDMLEEVGFSVIGSKDKDRYDLPADKCSEFQIINNDGEKVSAKVVGIDYTISKEYNDATNLTTNLFSKFIVNFEAENQPMAYDLTDINLDKIRQRNDPTEISQLLALVHATNKMVDTIELSVFEAVTETIKNTLTAHSEEIKKDIAEYQNLIDEIDGEERD